MGAKIAKCEICLASAPMACKPKLDKTTKKAKENRLPKKAVIYNVSKKMVEISGIEPLTS